MIKERNLNLDIIRGIAAYSVVANHVLSHYSGFTESIIGNINFSLQNPLFMMVSGWALIYSKPIEDKSSLFLFLKKRTTLLLLPWVIWSLLKYVLVGKDAIGEYFLYDLYHMEGMYWFLFSLWVMNVIFALSSFFFRKSVSKRFCFCSKVSITSIFIIGVIFVTCAFTVGVDLLGTKFTAYYFPFFLIGWAGAEMKNIVWPQKRLNLFHGAILASMILYAVLIAKVDVASLPDLYAPLRFLISSMGCLVLFYFVFRMTLNPSDKIVKFLNWGGKKR